MPRRRVSPEINALSTVLFVVILILLVLVNMRRSDDKKEVLPSCPHLLLDPF